MLRPEVRLGSIARMNRIFTRASQVSVDSDDERVFETERLSQNLPDRIASNEININGVLSSISSRRSMGNVDLKDRERLLH